jgi:hypothetical protein
MKAEFLIIKKEDDRCNSIETFKHMLEMDSTLHISEKEFRHKDFVLKYKLSEELIEDLDQPERVFHLELDRQTDNEQKIQKHSENFAKALKAIKKAVAESGIIFKIVPLWDDLSVYYAKKSYPIIHAVENVMRKLIYIFMYKKIGMDWLEQAAPDAFKEAVKKGKDRNSDKNPFQEILLDADFIHLGEFLFKNYRTADFAKLSEVAKVATNKNDFDYNELKGLALLSNWDRFFSEIVEFDGLEKKWKELYELRNKVAHNKHIVFDDFEKITNLSETITAKLVEAIGKIDEIDITREEREEVSENAFSSVFEPYNDFTGLTTAVSSAAAMFQNVNQPFNNLLNTQAQLASMFGNPKWLNMYSGQSNIGSFGIPNLNDTNESGSNTEEE